MSVPRASCTCVLNGYGKQGKWSNNHAGLSFPLTCTVNIRC